MTTHWRWCALFAAFLAGAACADPPGRVGRLSYVTGPVSFRDTYTGETLDAPLNWPITTDNVLATGPGGRAEVRVGSTALRIDGNTEFEVAQLDDQGVRLRLLQGSIAVRVNSRETAGELEVRIAQGSVLTLEAGRYRIDTRAEAGAVTTYLGLARFDVAEGSLTVRPGKRAEVWGAPSVSYRVVNASRDAFEDWVVARDQRDDAVPIQPHVSPEMTGYEDLNQYGEWRDTPDYGAVWYPGGVPAGWAPYQQGRWAWINPWGWTWVDAAPWGFAPFHYGRWSLVGNRWGWVPGAFVRRPVFAPALVGWVGRPGWSVSASVGPRAGWFPLGPREVFRPVYPASFNHIQRVNAPHVTNLATLTTADAPTFVPQHRQQALAVAPASTITNGRPIARVAIPIPIHALATPTIVAPRAVAVRPPAPLSMSATPFARPPQPMAQVVRPTPLPAPHVASLPAQRPAAPMHAVPPSPHGGTHAHTQDRVAR